MSIVTTVNSSKLSQMESDTATVNMLVKEAVNTYKAGITAHTFNGQPAAEATVGDVLSENGIEYDYDFFERDIAGETYSMKWSYDTEKVFVYNYDYTDVNEASIYISEDTTIVELAQLS